MTKLYRILGKRGRITIPYEIRKRVGFSYNDILSFAEQDDRTVIVRREKLGLELDSEAVSCWDNPTIASSASRYLERDLCGLLNKYSRDADITAVWIWAEPRTESSWDIYIGYA